RSLAIGSGLPPEATAGAGVERAVSGHPGRTAPFEQRVLSTITGRGLLRARPCPSREGGVRAGRRSLHECARTKPRSRPDAPPVGRGVIAAGAIRARGGTRRES